MKLEKVLKIIVVGGLFLIPLTPLIIANFLFFPFIVGKAFAFRFVIEIILAAWILLFILDKNYLPKISKILGAVFLFLLVITFASIFGVDSYRSFWSSFERMEGLITLLHLGAFFLVSASVFDKKLWRNFFLVSLLVSLVVSFYGLLQISGVLAINQGGVRVDGTLGNSIYLAVYLLFHIFISIFYFLNTKKIYRYGFLGLIILELLTLYFTASRGVILGLIGGMVMTFGLILFFERERKILRRNVALVLLAIVMLIGGFFVFRDSNFVKDSPVLSRFSSLSFEEIKTQGRYFIWPMALEGFKERPVLGYGQENFPYVFNEYYDPALFGQEPWFDRAHNVFLDWSIAGGILGLLSFLAIFFFLIQSLWRSDNFSVIDKSVLTGLIAAYLLQGIFIFDNLTSYIMFFSVAAFIYSLTATGPRIKTPFLDGLNRDKIKFIVAPVIIVIFISTSFVLNTKPLLANRNLLLAIHPNNTVETSLERFEKVFELNTFGNTEALFQLFRKMGNVLKDESASDEIRQKYFTLAKNNIEQLTLQFPNDAKLFLNAGLFYSSLNLHSEALKYLEQARDLSPTRPDMYLEIGVVYFSTGETEKALENFDFAKKLEPRNPEGNIRTSILFLYSDKPERAEPFLAELKESGILYSNDRLLNAFAAAEQNDRVLEIWQKRTENDPENITNRQSLVAAYILTENWNNAVNELNKIIEIDPLFKETGEYAIKEIRAGRGKSLVTK